MKNEQGLLLASVAVAALLFWGGTGLYASVDAKSVRGRDITTISSAPADPLAVVKDLKWPEGRNLVRKRSFEQRIERPKLETPPDLGLPWVRPIPFPGLGPGFWGALREPMTVLAKPGKPEDKDDSAAAPPPGQNGPDLDPAEEAKKAAEEAEKAKEAANRERVARAAKVVFRDGTERPCRLTPLGNLEGQEVWKLLEQWPNVRFRVDELNAQTALTVMGSYDADEGRIAAMLTIHLEKTLENEYHEERVRRALKDNDRAGQIEFARWVRANLGVKWGVPAVKLAIGNLRLAWAQGFDASLALMLGEFCRDAYDPETEIQTYLDYLQGPRVGDAQILVALGDAYERGGALHAARDAFAKAAGANDTDGRLRLGNVLLRLADRPAELRAAHDVFAKAQSAGSAVDKAQALAGMARARLAEGRVDEALALAQQAKQTDGTTFMVHAVLGSCLYVKGQFAAAETSFATASAMEPRGGTRARTNRAFAFAALDRPAEAMLECEASIKSDPLNFVDPLIGIGEAQQRWNDLTKSNDAFETALRRHPSHPWVLLRVATLRLRDGQPQQALRMLLGGEGFQGLLQVAPESVEGLRLAGLASADLQPADHESAIRYLRRALQKDPKNPELFYDLGRTLLAAGKVEEALALLEKATDSKEGPARQDARVLALYSFAQFDSGKSIEVVYETLSRAQRAVQDGWTKAWIETAREQISVWDRTRVLIDEFDRPAGERVANQWLEDDSRLDVGIYLDGKNAVFKTGRGSGAKAAESRNAATNLKRQEGLDKFVEVEFTVQADPGFEFSCHLWNGDLPTKSTGPKPRRAGAGAEVGFGRDRNGRMTLYVYGSNDKLLDVPVVDAAGQPRMWPEDGALHTLRITRTDHAKGVFELAFDGETLLVPASADGKREPIEVGGLSARRGSQCTLGVHVDADPGAPVQLLLDRVRIKRTEGLR